VYKWFAQVINGTDSNVNLIQTLINIPLAFGLATTDQTAVMDENLQTQLQFMILVISMGCIPIMLFVKPLILSCQHHHKQIKIQSIYPLIKEHVPHSFGELFIHQMIETIEFTLGCVSNTAS